MYGEQRWQRWHVGSGGCRRRSSACMSCRNQKRLSTLRHFEAPVSSNNEDEEMEYPMSVEAVGFCPVQPNWCTTGGVDGIMKIWDLTNGQCRQVCSPEGDGADSITRLRWHPTLPLVFTTTISGKNLMWDARN